MAHFLYLLVRWLSSDLLGITRSYSQLFVLKKSFWSLIVLSLPLSQEVPFGSNLNNTMPTTLQKEVHNFLKLMVGQNSLSQCYKTFLSIIYEIFLIS